MDLPTNPLDQLIHDLGGPEHVAEMTGRAVLQVQDDQGKIRLESRKAKATHSKLVNIDERQAFQNGTKLIAIISDASSSGVSLHADKRVANQRRRLHITLELPWSAEKCVQQLGRSHRSNQISAPVYKLLVSDCAGEQRFASATAHRLRTLGALLKADRRDCSHIGLDDFDINTKHGHEALRQLMSDIRFFSCESRSHALSNSYTTLNGVIAPKLPDGKEFYKYMANALNNVGLDVSFHYDIRITQFLNRLLGLKLIDQSLLFHYFTSNLGAVVSKARADGSMLNSIVEITGREIALVPGYPKVLCKQADNSTVTKVVKVVVDCGVSYDEAQERLQIHNDNLEASGHAISQMFGSAFYISKNEIRCGDGGTMPLVILVLPRVSLFGDEATDVRVVRPHQHLGKHMSYTDLHAKYRQCTIQSEAQNLWSWWFSKLETGNVGVIPSRRKIYSALSGDILSVLKNASALLGEDKVSMLRFTTTKEQENFVGVDIPERRLPNFFSDLQAKEEEDMVEI